MYELSILYRLYILAVPISYRNNSIERFATQCKAFGSIELLRTLLPAEYVVLRALRQ